MTTAHILYDYIVTLLFLFLVNLFNISWLSPELLGWWGMLLCERTLSVPALPRPLTSVTLTWHFNISQTWGSTPGQKPRLSSLTSHDHSLIYSHLPQPLIDGSHLINAIAVQGLLTCPVGTSSLPHSGCCTASKSPLETNCTPEKEKWSILYFAALMMFEKAEREKMQRGKWGNGAKGERLERGLSVWCEWFISGAGHLIIT